MAGEGEFREAIQRISDGTDFGADPRPAFDPAQAREFRAECIRGRKEESYVQALERNGFKFWPDAELSRRGFPPTGEGVWRCPVARYALCFTPGDLLGNFETPEAFDRWVKAHKVAIDLRGKAPREEIRKIVLAR